MSGDPELGLVYLPVEAATVIATAAIARATICSANSLVALDVKTGKMRWQYQIIHHDIWDWDNPSAPILADLPEAARKIVVQLTKQAFAYTFDRVTGKPIWPIKETPVPQTDVPGEWTSPTQPFPTKPAPFDGKASAKQDLIDFTPEMLPRRRQRSKPYRMGRCTRRRRLPTPRTAPKARSRCLHPRAAQIGKAVRSIPRLACSTCRRAPLVELLSLVNDPKASRCLHSGNGRAPRVLETLPLVKPPWGRITAIDMNSGEHRWWMANADTPKAVREHPALQGVKLPRPASDARWLLLTKTLLFAGEGWGGSPVLRAHDKQTGKILAEIKLPATQSGTADQLSVTTASSTSPCSSATAKLPAELVALSLPEGKKEAPARPAGEE